MKHECAAFRVSCEDQFVRRDASVDDATIYCNWV